MKIKTPYKNFTFSDDKSDCRFKLDVNASVVLDGQLNRFTIGQIKISPWPQDVPSQLEEMIERFIDNWFADICPQPEADYLGLLALSDYKPWVVITNARKLGKSFFVSADLSNWLPYYRQLKITKREVEALYETNDDWANRILDGACVKAMAGELEKTKILHPLFSDLELRENDDSFQRYVDTKRDIESALVSHGVAYCHISADGLDLIDSSEVRKGSGKGEL
ncbi:hypothetical protein AB733_23115 [Photobacterium swingsii]|uniref:Uncharacterized protein n=1 Tax=Photobacterium swingsii TaxID=680026 RepID=A0A0J8V555_9GAMM|nr:hypothetical protein [Photobacterium swingsii]KMV28568.1 hypothetical protein AB733_23115 [Photobacterium swingsii]PSW24539.1 hypothetical protein C9I94_10915 [Photobacterium swingsii]